MDRIVQDSGSLKLPDIRTILAEIVRIMAICWSVIGFEYLPRIFLSILIDFCVRETWGNGAVITVKLRWFYAGNPCFRVLNLLALYVIWHMLWNEQCSSHVQFTVHIKSLIGHLRKESFSFLHQPKMGFQTMKFKCLKVLYLVCRVNIIL